LCAQRDGNDRMLGSKILQMRLEHPEQKIDIVCRLRNFENTLVYLFIPERDSQRQFLCREINCCQTHGELLQKTAQHKKQRLGCFDFALKLETLLERLRRPNQFEQSTGSSIGTLPHADCFGAKSRPKLFLIQSRQLANGMDSPLVQNREDLLHLHLPFHAGKLQQGEKYVQVNIFSRETDNRVCRSQPSQTGLSASLFCSDYFHRTF